MQETMDFAVTAALQSRAFTALTQRFTCSGTEEKVWLWCRNNYQKTSVLVANFVVSLGATTGTGPCDLVVYDASSESAPTGFEVPIKNRLMGDTRKPFIEARGAHVSFSMSIAPSQIQSARAFTCGGGENVPSTIVMAPQSSIAISLKPPTGNSDMWARLGLILVVIE